ncbi:MAG: XTP/dITP diphosphatase [Planctomycetes bacterium]|nr:XTP/dITP diphosphatase [Planctomycetota bacterium]
MKLLIATSNRGKLREIDAVLAGNSLELKTLADFPGLSEVIENGDTFEANACKKASHYASLTRLITLADDSGLEVDALGGAPGVYSARYAGIQGDDAANNAKLLRELQGVSAERRAARFRCVVALADSTGILATASGKIEGRILEAPRGVNGFGYDPLFFIPECNKTVAELPPDVKNQISHRGRALAAIKPQITQLIISSTT